MTLRPALRRHRWLLLLVALYLLLGLAISVVVPLGEAPDELDHFRVCDRCRLAHRVVLD